MGFKFSTRSLERLRGTHTDLVLVLVKALQESDTDFGISEGLRDLETQRRYVEEGKSKTLNSRHLTGHAVDLFALTQTDEVSWDPIHYVAISRSMKEAARQLSIPLEWGGDWKAFKDLVHFQLPWKDYPLGE